MIRDPAWRHDGDLIVSWNFCGAVMELAGNLSVSISSPVSGQLGCQIIMPKDLAKIVE